MFRACHAVLSVHCSLVVAGLERTYLLVLLYVMFSCVLITFPCGNLGQAWYLFVSIPDICLLPYFGSNCLTRCILYHMTSKFDAFVVRVVANFLR